MPNPSQADKLYVIQPHCYVCGTNDESDGIRAVDFSDTSKVDIRFLCDSCIKQISPEQVQYAAAQIFTSKLKEDDHGKSS
jgi:hypothetical protein